VNRILENLRGISAKVRCPIGSETSDTKYTAHH